MVRRVDHHCLVEQVLVRHPVHKAADPLVHEGDLGRVQLPYALDRVVVELHVDHPRVGRFEGLDRDDALVLLDPLRRSLLVHEHARGVERLVRVEAVHAEEEGPLLLEIVHEVDAAAHHAGRRVVAVAVAVDRVPADHRAQPADLHRVAQLGQQVALDRAPRRGALEGLVEEAVGALRVAGLHEVERAPEVGEARSDQEGVVGAVRRLHPCLAEHLGHDRLVVLDRDPAGAERQALGRHVVAERERAHPGEQPAPGRTGGHRLRHRELEGERVLAERVEVRRLVERAVGVPVAEVVRARGVREDQQYVGRVLPMRGRRFKVIVPAGAHAHGRGAGGSRTEKTAPCEAVPGAHSRRQAS